MLRVDNSNPVPVTTDVANFVADAPKPAAHGAHAPRDVVEARQTPVNMTNVVVEMQRGNRLIYKFIDEASGKVIQQIPPIQLAQQDEIVRGGK